MDEWNNRQRSASTTSGGSGVSTDCEPTAKLRNVCAKFSISMDMAAEGDRLRALDTDGLIVQQTTTSGERLASTAAGGDQVDSTAIMLPTLPFSKQQHLEVYFQLLRVVVRVMFAVATIQQSAANSCS